VLKLIGKKMDLQEILLLHI